MTTWDGSKLTTAELLSDMRICLRRIDLAQIAIKDGDEFIEVNGKHIKISDVEDESHRIITKINSELKRRGAM